MSAYNELIKNFEKIRAYMRDFYVYGFKSRAEYSQKSSRSYDDERRRVESWLGEYMHFVRSREGKNMFISIDSRVISHNPLYKAWKTKSFTDRDIALHFMILDILHNPEISLTISEILDYISDYLDSFSEPMCFDESTLRKKLKEYISLGIIVSKKEGRTVYYSRAEFTPVIEDTDALHFFSEVAPCGVIGSYLLDKHSEHKDRIFFKHHYITSALDSQVLYILFNAISQKKSVRANNYIRHTKKTISITIVPLKVFISAQNGRQHILAYDVRTGHINPFRIDYLSDVELLGECPEYDKYKSKLNSMKKYMWGVTCGREDKLQYVEFTIKVEPDEQFIVNRLFREKRNGTVEKIDDSHYRFYTYLFDTNEIVPWIRTFICRITKLNFSDRTIENKFKKDIEKMYDINLSGGGEL